MSADTERLLKMDRLREFESNLKVALMDFVTEYFGIVALLKAENATLRERVERLEKEKGINVT